MDNLNTKEVVTQLNKIMQYELSGVVRYTHYALMITGRDRITLTNFTAIGAQYSSVAGAITDTHVRVNYTISGTNPSFKTFITVGIV